METKAISLNRSTEIRNISYVRKKNFSIEDGVDCVDRPILHGEFVDPAENE